MTEPNDDATRIAEVGSTAEELGHPSVEESGPALEESGRRTGGARGVLIPAVIAILLVASAAFAAWAYVSQYRPDHQTDAAVAAEATKAATDGTVALLSYTPSTLDQDFTNAKSHLTGDFLNYYTQFTTDIVTPAAKTKDVKTTATVVRSAVSELHPDAATVLVFINQNTTSKENPDGSFTASAVKVGLVKSGDIWLIAAFDPV